MRRALIHVVTDRRRFGAGGADALDAFERWLDELVDAGPDVVQLREHHLEARALRRLAGRLVVRARGSRVRVLINDRADVARAAGAAGVHLRADGPPVRRVREIGPAGWIVGRAIHSAAEAVEHREADYLLFGTVFPTRSKPDGAPVAGLAGLRLAAAAVTTPVLAIGGMTAETAREAVRAGAAGVAAVGVFLPVGTDATALGPARAVAALRAAMLE